jgi:mannitol/fructose-specific phosphotransferase system IIA component (Ntr-type)
LDLIRDKTWFLGALIERENVLTSAVGDGVAFPHTLQRHPDQVREPFLLVGRSTCGIDFGAPDGQRVQLVVLMGLRFQELHLPWLRKLTVALRQSEVRGSILEAADDHAIWDAICQSVPVGDA